MGIRPCDRLGEMAEARLVVYALEMVEVVEDCGEVMDGSVLASD